MRSPVVIGTDGSADVAVAFLAETIVVTEHEEGAGVRLGDGNASRIEANQMDEHLVAGAAVIDIGEDQVGPSEAEFDGVRSMTAAIVAALIALVCSLSPARSPRARGAVGGWLGLTHHLDRDADSGGGVVVAQRRPGQSLLDRHGKRRQCITKESSGRCESTPVGLRNPGSHPPAVPLPPEPR